MAETSKIYSALSAIMSECPAISKSQKNQQQGFMYRGVDTRCSRFRKCWTASVRNA